MWFKCPCDEFRALWVCSYSVLIDEFNKHNINTEEIEENIKENYKQIRQNIIKI